MQEEKTKICCKFSKTYNSIRNVKDYFCIYSSNDFDNMPPEVAKANRSGNAVVKVMGQNLPRLSDWTFQFEGEWKYNKKYGYTFYADRYEMLKPSSLKGIVKYLSSSAFPGVGPKTAQAIVDEFKDETIDVIEKTPELLLRVSGITIDKMGTIKESYNKNIAYSKLVSYLSAFGVPQNALESIYDAYGTKAIEKIKVNPYILQDFRGIGFYTCEKIARIEDIALDSYDRIFGAIKETIKSICESNGHMFMPYDSLELKAINMLNDQLNPKPVTTDLFRTAIKRFVKNETIVIRGGKYIFLKDYDEAEDYTAKKLNLLNNQKIKLSFKDVHPKVLDYCSRMSIKLSDNQQLAIEKSLLNRVSIITGGPGTGKTTILKALVEIYKAMNPEEVITLLAPTGKAARRMTETTGYPAQTVHSKLGIYDNYGAVNLIEPGLIVVDESSMLDSFVMYSLMRAIEYKNTQICFVGDVDQLPSVGSGLVLQDIIKSEAIPVSRLTEIFRQKGNDGVLIDNAYKVNHNDTNIEYDNSFINISVKDENEAIDKITTLYTSKIKEYGVDNVALLSPLRRTQNGRFTCVADGVNSIIQKELISPTAASVVFNGTEYKIGDRVLQWRNTKESSNGDIGTIKDIVQTDDGIFIKVDWENGNSTEENRETMSDITLAYAISIHKSQGSEYDCVIIPMLKKHICKMFRTNLLYTALTRAKKQVILITDCDSEAVNYCITNGNANNRNTMLAPRIKAYSAIKDLK